ncbi:PQQ-binding-like beta-propeller repeat protein [Reichenbachiella versicolor]|uniref:hypothetical protein n=1 Tax=Reichenbachiella versicolor TaxID=1821036 RepID=UPI000D6DECB3|nr:hypothetical protein [Reichenbachiella versicolor]
MKQIHRLTSLVILLVMTLNVSAQQKVWERDMTDFAYQVGWMEQTNDGTIIAAGAKGLFAMDNKTGAIKWGNETLKGVPKQSFQNIASLPIFLVDAPLKGIEESLSGGVEAMKSTAIDLLASGARSVIINSATGRIVYDTQETGYRIKNYRFLEDKLCLLFEMTYEGDAYIMKFDLKTRSEAWKTKIGGTAKGGLGKALNTLKAGGYIKNDIMFTKSGNMVFWATNLLPSEEGGKNDHIVALNFETGEKAWITNPTKWIANLVYSPLNNQLYMGRALSKKLVVYDPETGKDITPDKLKLRGQLIDVIPDIEGRDNLVLVETEGFNLIDPKSNTFKWKKSFKIPGMTEVVPDPKGYIANGPTKKGSEISLVDTDGKSIWDSKVKGLSYYVTPSPKGVLYITNERSNILDYAKGKDYWKKDVKFRAIPAVAYDDKEDVVMLFENKKGYKFDLKSGDIEQFAEDVILEDVNKKTPLEAEAIDAGYFIYDDQHVSLVDRDGKLIYTSYYKPLKSLNYLALASSVAKTMGYDIDLEGAMENLNKLKAISAGAKAPMDKQGSAAKVTKQYGGSVEVDGKTAVALDISVSRFFNSQQTKESAFLTSKDDQGKKSIFMIDKASGKEIGTIELIEKEPDYVIDEVDNLVFVCEKQKTIKAYKMK